LSPAGPVPYRLVGWLCTAADPIPGVVQLLVSGYSYDHNYWNMPGVDAYRYSYARSLTAAGYTVFAIDRIGVGQSDHPPAQQVTVPAEAYVLHQVVAALRHGTIGATRFRRVIGVGHSLGAAIWLCEAGTPTAATRHTPCPGYGDVDGLILADYLHQLAPNATAAIAQTLHPADDDPKFAGQQLPVGYLTTKPGTRGRDFYDLRYADPTVIVVDEAMKQTGTTGEAATIDTANNPVTSQAIQVPVLLVVGQDDTLTCDRFAAMSCADSEAIIAREAPYFSRRSSLQAFIVPRSGHDTNLHPDAARWFDAATRWTTWLPATAS
jgi:pimeloyl-ACP methyl ester carboxylesterase